jgi:hypothetical protein
LKTLVSQPNNSILLRKKKKKLYTPITPPYLPHLSDPAFRDIYIFSTPPSSIYFMIFLIHECAKERGNAGIWMGVGG